MVRRARLVGIAMLPVVSFALSLATIHLVLLSKSSKALFVHFVVALDGPQLLWSEAWILTSRELKRSKKSSEKVFLEVEEFRQSAEEAGQEGRGGLDCG